MPNPPPTDFRDAAVRQSLGLLAAAAPQARGPVDPMSAGFSLCIPAEDDGPRLLPRLSWIAFLWVLVGMLWIVGSCLFMFIARGRAFLIAFPLPLLGLLPLLYGGAVYGRSAMRKIVGRRLGSVPDDAVFCNVEDSQTIARQKVVPEDWVLLFPRPQERAIRLEGLKYRYVIHGSDVTLVSIPIGHAKHVQVDCRIGDVVLSLMLQEQSVARSLANSFGGDASAFCRRLADILGYQEQVDRCLGFPVNGLPPAAPPPIPLANRQDIIASLARGGIFVVYLKNGDSATYLDYAQGTAHVFPLFSSRERAMQYLQARGFNPAADGHVCTAVSPAWLQQANFANYCLLLDPGSPNQTQLMAADLALLARSQAVIM